MKIITITPDDTEKIHQMGEILSLAFAANWSEAWNTIEEGIEEVHECLEDERFVRVAVDDADKVLGWIGGRPEYDGNVWELHPLAVHPDQQGKGVGRKLVEALEAEVAKRGGITIYLGSDDTNNMTSLAGVDLYENMWEKIQQIRNIKGHPYEFYQKMGFQIVGVVPDANGIGKPDIMMGKRVKA